MEPWSWACMGIMTIIIVALFIKIRILQKAAEEIENAVTDKLMTETNTLIDISSTDKYMQNLANTINIQLRKLREERHRFKHGDAELKNAVTNISHDLRTPLTAICGYLDLLEQEEKSETVTAYLEIIRSRADLLTQLTEEFFRYSIVISDKNDAEKKPVVINGVLEESVAAFYAVLNERGISPNIQMPETKVIRALDRSALTRVFSNLLNNAIKYSDGDLDITLLDTGEIIFANMASELTEVQVDKLFDRFYTVEDARKSTGLGLAIARTLIEQMNGTITAKYENGRLSIHIFFP